MKPSRSGSGKKGGSVTIGRLSVGVRSARGYAGEGRRGDDVRVEKDIESKKKVRLNIYQEKKRFSRVNVDRPKSPRTLKSEKTTTVRQRRVTLITRRNPKSKKSPSSNTKLYPGNTRITKKGKKSKEQKPKDKPLSNQRCLLELTGGACPSVSQKQPNRCIRPRRKLSV